MLRGGSTYSEVSGPGEILSVLVEGHRHDSVCGVEGLLYPVAMVNVNVNVQHPLVVPERGRESISHEKRQKYGEKNIYTRQHRTKHTIITLFSLTSHLIGSIWGGGRQALVCLKDTYIYSFSD